MMTSGGGGSAASLGEMDVLELILAELEAGFGEPEAMVRSLLRLGVAVGCGAIIGYEREQVGKAAGLRTHILVATGSALVVVAVFEAGIDDSGVSRVIQGLVTGIGFLGAGAILKRERESDIRGLTTAAGIWMTSAIGVAAGLGRFGVAAYGTLFTWAVLSILHIFERKHLRLAAERDDRNRAATADTSRPSTGHSRKENSMNDQTDRPGGEDEHQRRDREKRKDETPAEDMIDESIEESFPASDPPAISPDKDRVEAPPRRNGKVPPKPG